MAGLIDGLGIGYSGLNAARAGVNLTGHNITNANTEGFHRRELQQVASLIPGGLGNGVSVEGSIRVEDRLLASQVEGSLGRQSYAESRQRLMLQLEQAAGNLGEGGLGHAISDLFNSFSELATAPDDLVVRRQVLDAADSMARAFNRAADGLNAVAEGADQEAATNIGELNDKAAEIAELNVQILKTEASGASAHDLRDRRQQLANELASALGTTSFYDQDGQMTVLVGSLALVQDERAATLEAVPDVSLNGHNRLDLVTGSSRHDVTSVLGGELGGLISVRDQTVPQVMSDLDQLAYDVATAVNTQHQSGWGLDGTTTGRNLFNPPGAVSGTAGSLGVDSTLTADLIGASSTAAGVPGNNVNALALAQLASANIAGGGTATAHDQLGTLVGAVGSATSQSMLYAEVSQDELLHLQTLQQSKESVSLDEEMVHLVQYQRAYQASAKVLSTVNELLGQLMSL